jgi:hypothetical protein
MAGWQFRCVCCGELREAPMARPEGTVYLRCIATREWAWYEPAAFIAVGESAAAPRNGGGRAKAPRSARGAARVAARAPRKVAGRRTRVAARVARGGGGRRGSQRARKRR